MPSHLIEFHILQSFPVTCLNRDDTNSPKTALVGGVQRVRVSSQCWKRQVRQALHDQGVRLATRTKQVDEVLARACREQGATEEQARVFAALMAEQVAKDTMVFLSEEDARTMAEFAKEKGFDVSKVKPKEVIKIEKLGKKTVNSALDALDIALFGRMVANAPSMRVEAASSFSHAISTHKASPEVDFFTAIDDLRTEPGSAHMGVSEFSSATYYRYVSLDLDQLAQTLDTQGLKQAVRAFVSALFVAVPAARQHTHSGACPWEFARVMVRRGQGLQASFETAVRSDGGGYLAPSIATLQGWLNKKEKLAGSLFGKVADFTFGLEEDFSIDDLIEGLQAVVDAQGLGGQKESFTSEGSPAAGV